MGIILYLISDVLSVITIALCLVQKFPQIINLYNLKRATGINVLSLLLELTSYTTTACYNYVNNYALLSYMEYPIIIFQQYILIFLVLKYKHLFNTNTYALSFLYFSVTYGFISGLIPSAVLSLLIPFCTPVSLSSKGIQLWEILKTKNTDSVSVTTWIISAFTNFTRVYTIYLDSADKILLLNFILSGFLSSAIATTTVLFKSSKSKTK